jgi:RNA polymerase sigma-70 factor (ECF subfamily)
VNDRDQLLLDRFRAGDRDAFSQLVEPYAPRVFSVLARMTGDRAAAEDLLQDALLQAYKALDRFRGECSFYTWIYRIAVNKTLNWIRRVKGRIHFESLDDPVPTPDGQVRREIVDMRESPETRSAQSEMARMIEEAMATLSPGNRIVFTMREIEGMEYEEIARMLECSEEAVRTRLHRAKKDLKERLRPFLSASAPARMPLDSRKAGSS